MELHTRLISSIFVLALFAGAAPTVAAETAQRKADISSADRTQLTGETTYKDKVRIYRSAPAPEGSR